MAYDFSALSLEQLRRETLERARAVNGVNDRTWGAMPTAFLGTVIAVLLSMPVTLLCLKASWWFAPLYVIPVLAFHFSNLPWASAMSASREYRAEMDARTEELNKRKRGG